jgi:Flp pilus assembly protein protease CpaA
MKKLFATSLSAAVLSIGGLALNPVNAQAGSKTIVPERPPAPAAAVPEPLTILGAATAMGFGAAFKRRALKNNKKG